MTDADLSSALVVEDAPTGIRSGKASGARVLATCTSHSRASLEKERPDYLVEDLSHVHASWDEETKTFRLIIEQPVDRREPRATPDVTPVVTPAGSRMNSFSGGVTNRLQALSMANSNMKGSDELTGNDSVVGSPVPSRPGSPGERQQKTEPQDQGVTLDAFKKALAGNNAKKRSEVSMEE